MLDISVLYWKHLSNLFFLNCHGGRLILIGGSVPIDFENYGSYKHFCHVGSIHLFSLALKKNLRVSETGLNKYYTKAYNVQSLSIHNINGNIFIKI